MTGDIDNSKRIPTVALLARRSSLPVQVANCDASRATTLFPASPPEPGGPSLPSDARPLAVTAASVADNCPRGGSPPGASQSDYDRAVVVAGAGAVPDQPGPHPAGGRG